MSLCHFFCRHKNGRARLGDFFILAALFAPLQPIAPTIWPSTTIGTPPCKGVKSGSAVMVKRPLLIEFSKNDVGFLKIAAVCALPMETFAPAEKLSSGRTK